MNIFQMSLSASVLIIAIIIIRSLLVSRLPKWVFLILWLIAVCRLIIPCDITSSFSIFNIFNKAIRQISETPTTTSTVNHHLAQNILLNTTPIVEATREISPIGVVWLIGVISLVVFFMIAYCKNYAELKTALPIKGNAMIQQLLNGQRLFPSLQILNSDKTTTPIAFGILKPKIILPKSMNLNDKQLVKYVFTHELQHIKHFDMLWKIVLIVALCLHWFNPLVWVMFIFANRDLELACDEKTVRQLGEGAKISYALSLISMAEQRSRFTPLYNGFNKNATEERIVSIMKYKKTSIITIGLSLTLVVGITMVFAFGASSNTSSYSNSIIGPTAEATQSNNNADNNTPYMSMTEEQQRDAREKGYAKYNSYGMVYNKVQDNFLFEGKIVRYFYDDVAHCAFTNYSMNNFDDYNKFIDLKPTYNKDGILTALLPASKVDFDIRTGYVKIMKKVSGAVENNKTPSRAINGFLIYKDYGLTYDITTDKLYYKGELVRYFEDYYPIDENSYGGFDHYTENGTVDVHAIRDLKQQVNADGSVDPRGKIIDVKPYTQVEFNERNIKERKNPEASVAFENSYDEAIVSGGDKIYGLYKKFGVTYDSSTDNLYYNNKLIRYFEDDNIVTDNKGMGSGTMTSHYPNKNGGDIDLYAVRNSNRELTGVVIASQTQFDSKTVELREWNNRSLNNGVSKESPPTPQ